MFEVRNGARLLRFEGRLLAESSSERPGSSRWIEFALYKTDGGTYVLTRVGVSYVYHSSLCPLVGRYGLHEAYSEELDQKASPCAECRPGDEDPVVFPESFRHWTLVAEDPEAIVEALYKDDGTGPKYLTRVAERLLQVAAAQDAELDMVYRFEYLD